DDLVVLAGTKSLMAYQLDDGQPAWDGAAVQLPDDAGMAGQGFVSGNHYVVALTSGDVVAIDLMQGLLSSRVRSKDGVPLGNLICHRGTILSQSGLFLDCFDQVDVLRQQATLALERNAEDAEALRSLAEIAHNDGRVSEAIELAERAYRAAPDSWDARDVLAECLVEALRSDFTSHRRRLPLLKELERSGAVDPVEVLRIEAHGLLAVGDPLGSTRACIAMARVASTGGDALKVSRSHEVAVPRWVQGQLRMAWDAASDAQRVAIREEIAPLVPADGVKARPQQVERFLQIFGALPGWETERLAHARNLLVEQRFLEAQQVLLDLADAEDLAIRREAVARLADQLHQLGLHDSAVALESRLAGEWAAEPCLDGKTGAELVTAWRAESGEAPVDWPAGRVDVRIVPTGGPVAGARGRMPLWGVRLEQSDQILGRGVGLMAARSGELAWLDSLGRQFFAGSLEADSHALIRQPGDAYGASRGNLLLLSLGREIVAFNTLPGASGASSLLWRVVVDAAMSDRDYGAGGMTRVAPPRPGSHRAPRSAVGGRWVGVIGPISSAGCVLLDQRRLACIDAVTGEVHWTRTDVPPGSDLFGDDRVVIVTPPAAESGRAYSVLDGRSLGTVSVPPWEERLVTRGRRLVVWRQRDGKRELAEIDPVSDETLWSRTFDAEAAVDIDQNQYVAVVEPNGRLIVLDLASNDVVVEQTLPSVTAVNQLHLQVGDDSVVLAIEQPPARNIDRRVQPLGGADAPVIDGLVFAVDRRTGQLRWSRPAEVLQQAMVIDQPANLPFISFAGALRTGSGGDSREAITLLLLDKGTGRTLYSSDELAPMGAGVCLPRVSDAARHEATVELAGRSLVLRFTDERRPPEPPAMADVESTAAKVSRGLLGILRSLGGAN
ncbi:MAG TPA: PQQ-binding-like beta-propeller repeat protein, partial [Lacipirellulaceae bacterium]|nr:PQQ-binding-like beta-propeller repeat protein [Lacipirellulaceae bacterium]